MSATAPARYPIPSYTVQPLREGIAVLKLLLGSIHPMSASQIARDVNIEHAQAQKLLYTLEIERLAERDERDMWAIHQDAYVVLSERPSVTIYKTPHDRTPK